MRWLLIATALLVFALVPFAPVSAAAPSLTVLSPAEGATIRGTNATITFRATDINIVPTSVALEEAGKRPEANRPGEGHVHFMLDLQPLVVWESTSPYTFSNVPPGEHQLMVELVENDHSSLSPPVARQIRFRTVALVPSSGAGPAVQVRLAGALLAVAALATVAGGLVRRRRV